MATRAVVETGQDRKALVADAGFSRLSFASVAAGVLTAYGAFAVLAGLVAGVVNAVDVNVDVSANWRDLGVAGGLVVAGLLLVAYLFGGYVAGRMARRAGVLHGVVVFVLGLAVVAIAAVFARQVGGAETATANLRDLGVPTTAAEWGDVATIAGIASLAAMLLGALAGGVLGERWHTKLLARALDPRVGAEAEAREAAETLAAEAEERRTAAFQRVRTTAPTRTVRADSEHAGSEGADVETATPETPDHDHDLAHAVHPAERSTDTERTERESNSDGHRTGDAGRNGNFWWRIHQPSPRRSSTDRS